MIRGRRLTIGITAATVGALITWALAASERGGSAEVPSSPAQRSSAKGDTPVETRSELKTPDKTLLFFMNPHGNPCKMQDRILGEMGESLREKVTVRYVKTTEPRDRNAFFTYGIRGLPSLILVDGQGEVLHRFAPGIQQAGTILSRVR